MKKVDNRSDCCSDYNKNNFDTKAYRYRVQVGVFRIYDKAMELQIQLLEEGYLADIERQGELYAVQTGDFTELDSAVMLERFLRFVGYGTMVVAV